MNAKAPVEGAVVSTQANPNTARPQKSAVLAPHLLRDHQHRVSIGPSTGSAHAHITVRKKNDIVQSIDITCTCGEKITIDLEY